MKTSELEIELYKTVAQGKNGHYFAFEVAMPVHDSIVGGYGNRERVDALMLETHGWNYDSGIWRCYELKVTKADFKSKAALSFYGHYNYFVLPWSLYLEVAGEIPDGIGVYAVAEDGYFRNAQCVVKPKRKKLVIPHHKLMFALMQRLSGENRKFMRQRIEKNLEDIMARVEQGCHKPTADES